MDASRFCGQQGSPLGSPPGQEEFVSPGNRLQLTFHAPTSPEDRAISPHKGFLALYQAVGEYPSWGCGLCPQLWAQDLEVTGGSLSDC